MKLKMVTGGIHSAGNMNVTTTQIPTAEPVKRPNDTRRSNKPIMEKRRRARINNCLNELKTLILDAMKKDPARHSKLEKADILEMTVKHLENLQRQQAAMSQVADPNILNKFKAGFTECANEVSRFPGIDQIVKRRMMQHLNNCVNGVKQQQQQQQQQQQPQQDTQNSVPVHILPSPPSSPEQDQTHHLIQPQQQQPQITATTNGYFLTNGTGVGVQLIPTKLSNGNIAFVLPQSLPVPTLTPIPQRTSSTASAASSTTSNYDRLSSPICYAPPSPANSYEAMDTTPALVQRSYSPAPLSLVMNKKNNYNTPQVKDEEQPWRPW